MEASVLLEKVNSYQGTNDIEKSLKALGKWAVKQKLSEEDLNVLTSLVFEVIRWDAIDTELDNYHLFLTASGQ